MVEVVGLDVGDEGGIGRQVHEGTVGLVCLDDVVVAGAVLGVGAVGLHGAADEEAGIEPHAVDGGCQHGGRGRLAVGAGAGERLLALAQVGEHVRAVPDVEPALAGGGELGVLFGDGGGDDDGVDVVGQVGGVVAHVDRDAGLAQLQHHARLLHVRSGDGEPALVGDQGDAGHPDAADADEVDLAR